MRRVDVGAHPQARVGDAHARRRRPARRSARTRARPRAGSSSCSSAERRRLVVLAAARQPRFDERVVVVARDEHELAAGERAAERPRRTAARRPSPRAAGPCRSSSTSPSRTTRSTPVERFEQRRAQLGAAQQVGAGEAAQVQVGDDQRAHRALARPLAIVGRGAAERRATRALRRRPPAATRLADRLREHEADVLADRRRTRRCPARRARGRSPRARRRGSRARSRRRRCRRRGGPRATPPATSPALSIRCASVPQSRATSTSRTELEELREPITSIRSQLRGHLLDGRLAVGRGVADVVGAGTDDLREALAQARDDRASFRRPRASSG